jgi:hypothetical protein
MENLNNQDLLSFINKEKQPVLYSIIKGNIFIQQYRRIFIEFNF